MSFFGIGKRLTKVPASSDDNDREGINSDLSDLTSAASEARERMEKAAARVSDLDARLRTARWEVTGLEARLTSTQEAAVEAMVRGEDPPIFSDLEAELRAARRNEHISQEALARASALLRAAEAESALATQTESYEKFASALRELMDQAARMDECHARLREIHTAAGGRYSPELLWPAFDSGDYYHGWLRAAETFLSQSPEPHQLAVNGAAREAGLTLESVKWDADSGRAERVDGHHPTQKLP